LIVLESQLASRRNAGMTASMSWPLRNATIVVPLPPAVSAGAAYRSITRPSASSTSRTGSGLSPRSQRRSTWLCAATTAAAISSARSGAGSAVPASPVSAIQPAMNSRNSRW